MKRILSIVAVLVAAVAVPANPAFADTEPPQFAGVTFYPPPGSGLPPLGCYGRSNDPRFTPVNGGRIVISHAETWCDDLVATTVVFTALTQTRAGFDITRLATAEEEITGGLGSVASVVEATAVICPAPAPGESGGATFGLYTYSVHYVVPHAGYTPAYAIYLTRSPTTTVQCAAPTRG